MRMVEPLHISMCHSVFIFYVTYIISQSTLTLAAGGIYDLINENPFGTPAPAVDANLDDGAAFPFVEAASDDEDD